VCVKQFPRRTQRLSVDDAGRHGDVECASEPLELHVLDACLAEGSRLRLDVPEQEREELFFLIPKVDTLFVPEELHEFPGGREPSRSIAVRGSTAQPHCLHESIVMVARKRDQGGVTLHSTTLRYSVVPAVLAELTRRRHHPVPQHSAHVVNLVLGRLTGVALWRKRDRSLYRPDAVGGHPAEPGSELRFSPVDQGIGDQDAEQRQGRTKRVRRSHDREVARPRPSEAVGAAQVALCGVAY
jgi:hypothetical protein